MISSELLESLLPLLQPPLSQRFEILDVIGAWCLFLFMGQAQHYLANQKPTNQNL